MLKTSRYHLHICKTVCQGCPVEEHSLLYCQERSPDQLTATGEMSSLRVKQVVPNVYRALRKYVRERVLVG